MDSSSNTFSRSDPPRQEAVARANRSFLSNVATLASGAGISEGIRVLGTLILARLIAPSDFGFLALFVTIVSIVSVSGGARYELAIMLPKEDREAANVAVLATLAGLGIALVSAVGIFALRPQLTRFLGDPRIGGWLWAVPVVLFLSAFGEVGRYWFGRTKNFHLVAIGKISQSAGVLGGQFGLWALHVSGGMALIGGWLIGQGAWAAVIVGCMLAKNGRFIYSSLDFSQIWALAIKHRAFPIYRTPYSFLANGASQLIFVVLRAFCGLDIIGLYLLANRAIYFPVALFGSSMGQVFYQKAATEINSPNLEPFVARLVRVQITFGVPLLIFFSFEAPLLFRTFLGARWQLAGNFAAWLAFAGFLYLLDAWLVRLFDVCGRQRLALILQIVSGGASLAALSATLYFGRSPVEAIAAFTISEVACSIVWLIFAYRISNFHVGNLAILAKDFAIAALPLASVVYAIHRLTAGWAAFALTALTSLIALAILWRRYGPVHLGAGSTVERFRRDWSDERRRSHAGDGPDFYRIYAGEIKGLFPCVHPERVLEIGCRDGSAFPYLGLPVAKYRGVDFSERFLDVFRSRIAEADLRKADGPSFVEPDERFDVIFSNEVVSYFDKAMLDEHLRNARRMMHSGSVLILGSVSNRADRRSGYASAGKSSVHRCIGLVKAALRRTFGIDHSGFSYTPAEMIALARRSGLRARVFPSRLQPDRFHVALSLAWPTQSTEAPDVTSRQPVPANQAPGLPPAGRRPAHT